MACYDSKSPAMAKLQRWLAHGYTAHQSCVAIVVCNAIDKILKTGTYDLEIIDETMNILPWIYFTSAKLTTMDVRLLDKE